MKKYMFIILGAAILSFGIYNIHARCFISEGGVLGLSLLFYRWFHISPGLSCLIMDCMAIIAGTIVLEKNFLLDSIIASVVYASWYRVYEFTGPLFPDLSSYPLLASIIGALFVGIGTAFIVMYGCAAGADDSMALIFHKVKGIKLSTFYFLDDFIVLILSLSYIPFNQIFYSLLSVILSSNVIEWIVAMKNKNI